MAEYIIIEGDVRGTKLARDGVHWARCATDEHPVVWVTGDGVEGILPGDHIVAIGSPIPNDSRGSVPTFRLAVFEITRRAPAPRPTILEW